MGGSSVVAGVCCGQTARAFVGGRTGHSEWVGARVQHVWGLGAGRYVGTWVPCPAASSCAEDVNYKLRCISEYASHDSVPAHFNSGLTLQTIGEKGIFHLPYSWQVRRRLDHLCVLAQVLQQYLSSSICQSRPILCDGAPD
jgi:hypothetical protein